MNWKDASDQAQRELGVPEHIISDSSAFADLMTGDPDALKVEIPKESERAVIDRAKAMFQVIYAMPFEKLDAIARNMKTPHQRQDLN